MTALFFVGQAVFFLVGLVVGLRLLHLWTRTRRWPELVVGLTLLLCGPLGYSLAGLAHYLRPRDLTAASVVFGGGIFMVSTAGALVAFFTWRIFRPESRLAGAAAVAVAAAMAGGWVGHLLATGFDPHGANVPVVHATIGVRAAAFLWGGFESLRYWRMMRRRLALGLADPLVANRFLLWALALACVSGVMVFAAVGVATAPPGALVPDSVVLGMVSLGLVASVTLWLAFLPPAAYRRWVHES